MTDIGRCTAKLLGGTLSWVISKDDADKVNHVGLHHLAFEYDSFDDLMVSYARLETLG